MSDIAECITVFKAHKNNERKKMMEAYMKNQFSYLGLPSPLRMQLEKPFIQQWKKQKIETILPLIFALHRQNEREFMYTAQRLFMASLNKLTYENLIQIIPLLKVNSWWDNSDGYNMTFKRFFKKNPQYIEKFISHYSCNDNLWICRLAIICQLGLKEKTNQPALEKAIKSNMHNQDFFIQKAIGWALRNYGETNPHFVRSFVENAAHILSPLAKREALRRIAI